MIKRLDLILSITLLLSPLFASNKKLFFGPCKAFSKNLKFDCYRDFKEMSQFLKDAQKKFPQLTKLESIGKSYEGRDLWLMTITDFKTGKPEDKPAIWIDGGVDSDEVISTEAALGLIHRLLTSNESDIENLRKTRVFYILPNLIPDGSELHHHTALRPRDSTLKPWDDDNDGKFDEDPPEDLDGDNMALQMRVESPSGKWVKDEKDDRLLRQRKPDDPGPYYERYSEGIDNDGDGKYNEDWPGGIDPNRNYPGNWSVNQRGSGAFPGSEVELRSALDFIYDHPNIAASQSLHSTGGVILRPPSVPEMKLPNADLMLYIALSERGLKLTKYGLATSVYKWNWPRGSKNTGKGQLKRSKDGKVSGIDPFYGRGNYYGQLEEEDTYAAYGGALDGLYELFGILAFANEIYQFGTDLDNDGRVSPSEQLKYDDKMGSDVFKAWTPFDHPDLGKVEIGGWKKFGQNNPLPPYLDDEVDRNVDFMLMQARAIPLLSISDIKQEYLGKDISRVTATISNTGFQPTELSIRFATKKAVPVRAYLSVSNKSMLLDEDFEKEIDKIDGNSKKDVSWLVYGTKGDKITINAFHPKGGRTSKEIKLIR